MARFTIYSPTGTPLYTGTPTFTGQYMKPGLLEFREVALAIFVELVPGCYVGYERDGAVIPQYSRTGLGYKIYTAPQLKKQARSASYGGAFVYQSVQLYDASKMLEYCPFRDLVTGDNRIHFSTQPSISTFEGCDGLARRFEACLVDQYGAGSWKVRIATIEENPALHDLMLEPRDFTVSGVNILECLDKIYEIWPEVGWVYKVEEVDGVPTDTIVIGGGGANPNVGTYAYGKGNGLTSLTRTAANAEEIANRIFAYGSSRNMVLPSWYRNQDIKDAESVDIQNLMLPIGPVGTPDTPDYWPGWGETDGERDAAKAFVENAASILKNGLRPSTVYFDGKGEYPEIYPSIRETTIGMVRTAIGDSTAKYYPSTTIYTNPDARIDKILSAQSSYDSGLAGDAPGKANVEMGDTPFSASGTFQMSAGITYYPFYHYQGSWTPETAGIQNIAWKLDLSGQVQLVGIEKVIVSVRVKDPSYQGPVIVSTEYELTPDASGVVALSGVDMFAEKVNVSSVTYTVFVEIAVSMAAQGEAVTGTYTANGNVGFALQNYRKKTFNITLRQIGFDINEQANLADGKVISMRTGDCAGRSFAIKSVQYDSTNDAWALECWRTEDESLSQWFPNSQFGVAGGDEFVLLDIAMPDIYIAMASQKLLVAARELLADSAVERWQYNPEIDAKYMVENARTINAGEAMTISDPDIIGENPESVIVDTITISEGESPIPTYKVTLRDRKKKTWTEAQMPEASSSKSVGNTTTTVQPTSTGGGDSFFQLDESGNVTLKSQYQNLWVPGWLAAGGVGQGGGGGGSVAHLSDIGDVAINQSTLADGQGIVWDNTNQVWKNANLLPTASTSQLGGVKVDGTTITINNNGVISAVGSSFNGGEITEDLWLHTDEAYYGSTLFFGDRNGDSAYAYITEDSDDHLTIYGRLGVTITTGDLGSVVIEGLSVALDELSNVSISLSDLEDGQSLVYRDGYWQNEFVSGGGGGGGSYSAGTGININSNNVISLKTASTSQLGGVKVDGTTITISNGVISASGGGGGGYIGYTAVHSNQQNDNLLGISSVNATNSSSSLSRMVWESANNAWHFYGNIYADGWIAAGGIGSGGGGGGGVTSLYALDEVLSTTSPSTNQVFYFNGTKWTAISLKTINNNSLLGSGNINISGGGGGSTVSWGQTGEDFVYLSVDNVSKKLLTAHQSLTNYVTLNGDQEISGEKTFKTKPVNIAATSGLKVSSQSYIDLGPIRIKFENNALHITKVDPNDTNNYGLYADGFVAAGGVGQTT